MTGRARESLHVEPQGPANIARHYIRELISALLLARGRNRVFFEVKRQVQRKRGHDAALAVVEDEHRVGLRPQRNAARQLDVEAAACNHRRIGERARSERVCTARRADVRASRPDHHRAQ